MKLFISQKRTRITEICISRQVREEKSKTITVINMLRYKTCYARERSWVNDRNSKLVVHMERDSLCGVIQCDIRGGNAMYFRRSQKIWKDWGGGKIELDDWW